MPTRSQEHIICAVYERMKPISLLPNVNYRDEWKTPNYGLRMQYQLLRICQFL